MQNQPVVGVLAKLLWRQFGQAQFNFERRLAFGEAGTVRDSKYMRVYRNRWLTEGGIQNNTGRFSPYARQGLQLLSRSWHLTIVSRNQLPAGFDDVFCLAVIEAYRLDITL